MNTCEKCKFWEDNGTGRRGSCHRYPAQIVCRMGNFVETFFPEAAAYSWCGEFQHACPHVKNV